MFDANLEKKGLWFEHYKASHRRRDIITDIHTDII